MEYKREICQKQKNSSLHREGTGKKEQTKRSDRADLRQSKAPGGVRVCVRLLCVARPEEPFLPSQVVETWSDGLGLGALEEEPKTGPSTEAKKHRRTSRRSGKIQTWRRDPEERRQMHACFSATAKDIAPETCRMERARRGPVGPALPRLRK